MLSKQTIVIEKYTNVEIGKFINHNKI